MKTLYPKSSQTIKKTLFYIHKIPQQKYFKTIHLLTYEKLSAPNIKKTNI